MAIDGSALIAAAVRATIQAKALRRAVSVVAAALVGAMHPPADWAAVARSAAQYHCSAVLHGLFSGFVG
eukprot:6191567-Amphidinium_carterae.1